MLGTDEKQEQDKELIIPIKDSGFLSVSSGKPLRILGKGMT